MAFYKGNLTKRLIVSYPDCIVTDDDCNVDFEETVYNFATAVMENIDAKRQNYYFGEAFLSHEACVYYIRNYMQDLLEECQNFVNKNEENYEDYNEDL